MSTTTNPANSAAATALTSTDRLRAALIQGFHVQGYSAAKARAAGAVAPIEYDPAVATDDDVESIATTEALRRICDAFHTLCDVNTAHIIIEDARSRGETLSPAPSTEAAKPGRFVDLEVPAMERLTLFHSKTVPVMTLAALALALRERTKTNTSVVIGAIIIVARFCNATRQPPNAHTQHRLFVAALFLSAKIFWDRSFRVSSFAKHAGIGPSELRKQERVLAHGCDWHVVVTARDVEEVVENVVGGTARGEAPKLSWFTPARRPALDALHRRHDAAAVPTATHVRLAVSDAKDVGDSSGASLFAPLVGGDASISTRGNFSLNMASDSQHAGDEYGSSTATCSAVAEGSAAAVGSALQAVRATRPR